MQNVITELKNLFENNLTGYKTFYDGLIDLPPRSYLPALMVDGLQSEIIAKSTAKDQVLYNIIIRVVLDVADYFKESGTSNVIAVKQKLRDMVEGRNSNGTLKTDTVLYQLRNNVRGTNYLINNNIIVRYETEKDLDEKFFYVKAEIELEAVTDLIIRP